VSTLHFICGKAGSGKTTLARALGRSLPAVVFCEDEWICQLGFEIKSLADFAQASAKCRSLIDPLAVDLLRLGVSVVLDFAGNTPKARHSVRALFEAAGADHRLHLIEASDAECLANIHKRNEDRPAGIFWGEVSDEIFHAVTAHFARPRPEEGFHIVRHTGLTSPATSRGS
jgi:predicted kinase